MAMTSLGVGSGIDLDQMVRQLVQLEKAPKAERLDTRAKDADTNISALGSLKSAMSKLDDALNDLSRERTLNARSASIKGQPEDNPYFTANAASSAATSNYSILVNQTASGSRLQSGSFTNAKDPAATSAGQMTFSAGDESFYIEVEEGASLQDIADSINRSDSNFGLSASIINTGTESFLVFDSSISGAGNDLSITSSAGGLDALTDGNLSTQREAKSAEISIDGLIVQSETNTFENAIQGVSIEVSRTTPADMAADDIPRLSVDIDQEGVREMIDGFIEAYNATVSEIEKLTKYAPEGKSGPLIGDSMVRSIQSRMNSIVASTVPGASDEMNMLFQLGITTNKEGRLEFDSRNIGGGTGEERFEKALTQNFDSLVDLFAGENGIATQMKEVVNQYTQADGLIDGRTSVYENQKKMVDNEREQFERYMQQYEANLRQRFGSLDTNIARMQNDLNFLLQYI